MKKKGPTRKMPKAAATRGNLTVKNVDRNLWKQFKQCAKDKDKLLRVLFEEALREKIEREYK